MKRMKLPLVFVLSLLAGLVISACAGVTAGGDQIPVAGGPVIGPLIDNLDNLSLPALSAPAEESRVFARPAAIERAVNSQMQAPLHFQHWCNGDDM